MRSFLVLAGLALTAFPLAAQSHLTENQAVAYAKSVDVHILDPSLSSQRLEDWLRSGSPHLDTVQWISDATCDIHPDPSFHSDYPSCVRIEFRRGGQEGYLLVLIGTLKKGIIGPPKIYYGPDVMEPGFVQTGGADRLSGLTDLLDQPAVTVGVSDLYEKIVALHPFGIPKGADKTVIWPYLSRRLARHLENAEACEEDYLRQVSGAGSLSKPNWMTSDLFAGENERDALFFVNTVHKEPLKDGTFAVELDVVERNGTGKNSYIVAGGIPAYAVKRDWLAIATVVQENNKLVVDDIRIFDGASTDGPSHLLSESFNGCDGSHWTGQVAGEKAEAVPILPSAVDWNAVNALRSASYDKEVAFAKAVDVHELDPSLPPQRFGNWINSASLRANNVEWNAGQCNIKEGPDGATPNPQGGLCAWARFERGNARVAIQINKSASERPRVEFIDVSDRDEGLRRPLGSDNDRPSDSKLLSDLPRLLDEESVIDVTRNLYDTVVVRHPLGVPVGVDKVRFSPLLSKHLNEQLATAQVCQEDYRIQSVASVQNPKPAWLKTGLFSGEGPLALPTASLVDHKTQQSDGSFLVYVWLSRKLPPSEVATLGAPLWRSWYVVTTVIREGGRFVVDDVRLFDEDSTDGSRSHLLSESFDGCVAGAS